MSTVCGVTVSPIFGADLIIARDNSITLIEHLTDISSGISVKGVSASFRCSTGTFFPTVVGVIETRSVIRFIATCPAVQIAVTTLFSLAWHTHTQDGRD